MSDSDVSLCDEALDQEFLHYLSLADKFVRHKDLKRCQKWFDKLCSKLYTSREAKKRRNVYLVRLLNALHRNQLESPFDSESPADLFPSPEEMFRDITAERGGEDFSSDRSDKTYTLSKPLCLPEGVCGSLSVTIGKNRNYDSDDCPCGGSKISCTVSEAKFLSDQSAENITDGSGDSVKSRARMRKKFLRQRSKSATPPDSENSKHQHDDIGRCHSFGELSTENLILNFFEDAMPKYFEDLQSKLKRRGIFDNEAECETPSERREKPEPPFKIQRPRRCKISIDEGVRTTKNEGIQTVQPLNFSKFANCKLQFCKLFYLPRLSDHGESPHIHESDMETPPDSNDLLGFTLETPAGSKDLLGSKASPERSDDTQNSGATQKISHCFKHTNLVNGDVWYQLKEETSDGVCEQLFEPIRNLAGGYDGPDSKDGKESGKNRPCRNHTELIKKPSVQRGKLITRYMKYRTKDSEIILSRDISKEITPPPKFPSTESRRSKSSSPKRDFVAVDREAEKPQTTEKVPSTRMTPEKVLPTRVTIEQVSPSRVTTEKVLPTRVTIEQVSPTRVTTEKASPTRVTTERVSPTRVTIEQVSPTRVTTEKVLPTRVTIEKLPTSKMPTEKVSSSNTCDEDSNSEQQGDTRTIFDDLYEIYPEPVVDRLLQLWNIEGQLVMADYQEMYKHRIEEMQEAASKELESKAQSIQNGKQTLIKFWECKKRIDRLAKSQRFSSDSEEQQKQLMEALHAEISEEKTKLKREIDLNKKLKVGLAKVTLEKEEQDASITAMKDELRNLAEQLCDELTAICDDYGTQHVMLHKKILGWFDFKTEATET